MNFRFTFVLIGLCAGMSAQGVQRDSSSVAVGLGERLSPAGHFMHEVYSNPAAQVYRYRSSLTTIGLSGTYRQEDDALVMQQGRGNRYAAFDADSYIRHDRNTIWGGAGYRVGRTMHTEWNENADFELLYPYVWADSVGGNLISERYTFAGGFAREFGRVAWGIYADYRAEIEYRKVDPRPHSVVSDLNLATGATLSLGNRYSLGASVDFRIYRQKSGIRFLAPLGGPKMYQMLGLGMYSTRFSTGVDGSSVNFSGRSYGVGLELFPRQKRGLSFSAHYSDWAVRRMHPINQENNIPLTRLTDRELDGALGWQGVSGIHHWGIKLSGNYGKRRGTEYIYGEVSGNTYPRIGSVEQYRNNRADLVLSALWGFEEMRGWSFYAEPRGRYYDFEATYLSPSRKMQFGKVGCGGGLTVEKRLRRSVLHLSVSADYLANRTAELKLEGLDMDGSIGQMMQRNFGYLSADMTLYGASFRWNYDFPRASMALYVQGDWQHGSFADGNRSDYARIVFGVAF